MDALILLVFVIVLSVRKLRMEDKGCKESVSTCDTGVAEPPLEIGTNLMLNYEADAFELILKEFGLK